MHAHLKNIVLANLPIKVISLILGYTFWAILGSRLYTDHWITIPLSFYNKKKGMVIKAPETVTVALSGTRTDLINLDNAKIAAHIDAVQLKRGTQLIELRADQLLLPNSIHMIHSKPSNIVVTVDLQ